MSSMLTKREDKHQRWRERIQAWKQSGLTQKEFCEHHHLGLSTFQRWRRILAVEVKPKESAAVSFLPVGVVCSGDSGLTVLVNDQLRIEVSTGFDTSTLKRVIGVLQA